MNRGHKDAKEFGLCFGNTKRFGHIMSKTIMLSTWHEFGGIRFFLFAEKGSETLESNKYVIVSIARNTNQKTWEIALQEDNRTVPRSVVGGLDEEKVMSTVWRYLSIGAWPMREV